MTLIALKQICDQLKEAIGLDDEHNVAALIDEDCDTEVKGWTIVSVSNSGEIKPCTSQSFSTIKELMYSWIEKQAEQKTVVIIPKFRVGDVIRPKGSTAEYAIESISGECYHGKGWGLHLSNDDDYELVEQKPTEWSEEDERICQCLIQDQEEAFDKVSNDKYGHSEIISDLEEMYRERIAFLKSLKDRVQPQNKWKPDSSMLICLEYAIKHINKDGDKRILSKLLEQLKKL